MTPIAQLHPLALFLLSTRRQSVVLFLLTSSSSLVIATYYSQAVEKLQGVPVELPYFDPLMSEVDRKTWVDSFGVIPWKDSRSSEAKNHKAYPHHPSIL